MKKVNFAKIPVRDITGNVSEEDFRQSLGNALYKGGMTVPECELGVKIYHSKADEELELTDEEVRILKEWSERFPVVSRRAFNEVLK